MCFVSQVLLNNEFPFKFGGKAFDFVLDVFLYHDFSVLGFVRIFEVWHHLSFLSILLDLIVAQCEPIDSKIV